MKHRLTPDQKREFKSYLEKAGWDAHQIGELLHPERAWSAYHLWKAKGGEIQPGEIGAVSKALNPPAQAVGVQEKRRGRGPGKKPAKQVTTVQLDPDMLEGLQQVAEREERTVSAVIRLAIRDYLEKVNG